MLLCDFVNLYFVELLAKLEISQYEHFSDFSFVLNFKSNEFTKNGSCQYHSTLISYVVNKIYVDCSKNIKGPPKEGINW